MYFQIYIITLSVIVGFCSGLTGKDLNIRLYEVDERNSVRKVLETNPNSDVILDGINRIRLECNAPFPVQWIYTGNGVPTLVSTIRKERDQKFMASAFITSLKESHSGRYECTSTASPESANAHFYLYVPGQTIFTGVDTSEEGKPSRRIWIPKNDSTIQIPCAVSNPKIRVTLEKSAGDVIVSIKPIGRIQPYSFDPKVGFTLDTRQIEDPEGVYVCTAFGKGRTQSVEFLVRSNFQSNSGYLPQASPMVGKDGVFRCSTHTDCPPNWSCYTDLTCRDPCIHSIRCGREAVCKYNDRRPYCECPKDFIGDPMKECFNTLQGSEPEFQNPTRPKPSRPTARPNPRPTTPKSTTGNQCKVNQHCAQPQICLNGNCIDPCALKICERNAYCITDASRIAKCVCSPGFSGRNGQSCTSVEVEKISREEQNDAPRSTTRCSHNRDCPLNTICKMNKVKMSSCVELCGSRVCGENASCRNGLCICKKNHVGDPFTYCSEEKQVPRIAALQKEEEGDCSSDTDCAQNEKCHILSPLRRKCTDACLSVQCPHNSECEPVDHSPTCKCPKGSTKTTLFGCTKVIDTTSDFIPPPQRNRSLKVSAVEISTQSSTLSRSCSAEEFNCGPNAVCRHSRGIPTCFCEPRFIGNPPNCKRECTFNIECPTNQACVRNKCRNACRNKCGPNARCRVSTGASRTHNCSCRSGFEGNPESMLGCTPIRTST